VHVPAVLAVPNVPRHGRTPCELFFAVRETDERNDLIGAGARSNFSLPDNVGH